MNFLSQWSYIDLIALAGLAIAFLGGFFGSHKYNLVLLIGLSITTFFARLKHVQFSTVLPQTFDESYTRYAISYVLILVIGFFASSFAASYLKSVMSPSPKGFTNRLLSAIFSSACYLLIVFNLIYLVLRYWTEYLKYFNTTAIYRWFSLFFGIFG